MPGPDVVLTNSVESLVEQYMERMPACFLCREAPGVAPMIFVADATGDGGRRRCALFATCAVCLCADDFEHRVTEALWQDQHQREAAPWN